MYYSENPNEEIKCYCNLYVCPTNSKTFVSATVVQSNVNTDKYLFFTYWKLYWTTINNM